MSEFLDPTILAVILRVTTPILLATIGALYSEKAGVPNITMEASMLCGAFSAVAGSYFLHSAAAGVLAAIMTGILIGLIFALFVLKLGGNEVVVGVALILIAGGFTIFLLNVVFDTSGSFMDPGIVGLATYDIPLLSSIPIVKELFSNHTLITYFAFLSVLITHIIIYKTSFGLKISACGENPQAASTVGINVFRIRLIAILITGALSGLAGAQLSLGFLSMFSENMTAGRGFIAIAAVIFAQAVPVKVLLISLVFGFAEAVSNQLQLLKLPSEIVLMLPYLFVVLAMLFKKGNIMKRFKRVKDEHS